MRFRTSQFAPLLIVLLAAGCGRDGITVYTVPKEQPAPLAHTHPPTGQPTAPAVPPLRWELPAGWTEGAVSEFRAASFRIKGPANQEADLSVVPLPGTAGGDLSNVNRWRAQVSQPPLAEDELQKSAERIEIGSQPALLYDQAGEGATGDPTRILAAILHRAGTAWFFKMTGDSEFVAQQKRVFIEFLKSFQFVSAPPPATAARPGLPQWNVPAGWTEVAGGQFLVAKFVVEGAAINVSSSSGDGGGVAANVNRWRKQLGLTELNATELAQSVTTIGNGITLVEMSGTDARSGHASAVVGAMVFQPGQAWFYKLMGDAPVVAAQKAAFIKFVQEVAY